MIYINGESVAPVITQGIDVTTTPEYVTNGLIALYDGIKNTRSGHANQPTAWADLSGNTRDLISVHGNNPFFIDGACFNIDSMEMRFAGASEMEAVKTIEIVYIVRFGYCRGCNNPSGLFFPASTVKSSLERNNIPSSFLRPRIIS